MATEIYHRSEKLCSNKLEWFVHFNHCKTEMPEWITEVEGKSRCLQGTEGTLVEVGNPKLETEGL
jgi:hypothetical protein